MNTTGQDKSEIFNSAVEITNASDRAAYLMRACGTNLALRAEIEELLKQDCAEDSLLDRSTPGLGLGIANQYTNEKPGDQIGPYKLREVLGEGGMGAVYCAEQEKPVRRKVALKIIKPGMDTREVISRFEAERQALAMMDHQNIARVLDAGATDRGRPYFVMELVRGVTITEYCNKNKRTIRQRLELFAQVCRAVQHAHQKGIIHRDIKPSNVMVAVYDGVPVPKVIDFGIAKAIDEQLTEKTFFTRFGQMVGTLEYMSPEQAQLNQLDVDTRSDIYSLGVMLYELLTGSTPFTQEELSKVSFDEMRRIIRETDPQQPSDRISTLRAEAISTITSQRGDDPRRLTHALRGELDWIVMKTLEKDRTRRYETANDLAADVQRYLDDEPVVACPPSATYRFRKFARRNKVGVAFASLILLGLTAGIIGLGISNQIIFKEKQLAQSNYRVAIRTLDELVNQAAQVERMVDLEGWRRTTLERALDYYTQFANQNSADPDVTNELLRVREKQTKIHLLLENFQAAEAIALSGIDLVRADENASYDRITLATIWRRLAEAYHFQGKTQQADDAWQQAYEHFRQITESQKILSGDEQLQLADFLRFYAAWQIESGSPSVALQSLQMAADHCSQATADDPTSQAALFMLGTVNENLGHHYRRGGNETLAMTHYHEALTLANELSETRAHLQLRANCLWKLGTLFLIDGRTIDQAESHYRAAVDIYDQLVEDYPWDVYYRGDLAALTHNLAVALKQQGKIDEARQLLERAATGQSFMIKHKPQNADHQLFWAKHQLQLANIARDLRQFELAKEHYETALDHFDKLAARWSKHRDMREHRANVHNDYAKMILSQPGVFGNKPVAQLAEEQIRQALEIFETLQAEFPGPEPVDDKFPEISEYYSRHLRKTYTKLAKSLNAQQRFDEAIVALKKVRAHFERAPRLRSPTARYQMANTLLDLAGMSLIKDDDPVEVENMYREGLQMMTTAYDEDPMVVEQRVYTGELQTHYWGLARALYKQHRYVESKQEFERASSHGQLWIGGLRIYADHLLECPDNSFRDYRAALKSYQEILSRGPKDNSFVGSIKHQIGICHYRLAEFKQAKSIFADLMSNSDYSSTVHFSIGYYMAMTLTSFDEADDTEGPFHKPEARKIYDLTLETHQRRLQNGTISDEDRAKYERLRQESAEVIGIESDEATK